MKTSPALLTKVFSGAKAQRFIKLNKTILNTVKIDMPTQSDLEIALQNCLFLNNQYFRAYEFNQEEGIPIIQCYIVLDTAKTCKNLSKCGKCSEAHATSNFSGQAEKNCANCQLNHQANDTNCQTYQADSTKVYIQRNIHIPSFLPGKIDSSIWNNND